MVHLAVEQFHLDHYAFLFCKTHDLFETFSAVIHSSLIIHSATVAAEADQVLITGFGNKVNVLCIILDQFLVILFAVPAINEVDFGAIAHGREDAVLLKRRPVFGTNQVNSTKADLLNHFTEFFNRNEIVAPGTNGVIDITFHLEVFGGFVGDGG